MGIIEQKVVGGGRWSDLQSVDNAVAMFEAGKEAIALPAKSGKGYTRRGAGLAWTTVFKELSVSRRTKKAVKSGRNKRDRVEESKASSSDDEEEVEEAVVEHQKRFWGVRGANSLQPPKKRHSNKV